MPRRAVSALALLVILMSNPASFAEDEVRNFVVDRDVVYLAPDRKEKLDLYLPPDPKPGTRRGAIVVIHGGGWQVGDKADPREKQIATTLANAGYVVASINYQLATRDTPAWPTCLADCRAAVTYLREHADELSIDPNRIGAIGGSAGGTMSLLIGVDAPDAKFKRINAVVALYPPTDLLNRQAESQIMFGASRAERPDLFRDASPVFHVTKSFPPTLLFHGTADATVSHEQSETLAAKFKELGVPHELILMKDAPHTFRIRNESHDLREKIVSFFDKRLKQ